MFSNQRNFHHHPYQFHQPYSPWQLSPNLSDVPTETNINSEIKENQLPESMDRTYCGFSFGNRPNKAYFCPQPPVGPIKLVLIGDVPNNTHIKSKQLQQLLKNIKIIEENEEIVYESPTTTSTNLSPSVLEEKTITKETVVSFKKQPTKTSDVPLRKPNHGKRNPHEIRKLLHQLITDMPIADCKASASPAHSERALNNQRSRSQTRHMTKSPFRESSPISQRPFCSIAVQARSDLCSNPEDKLASVGDPVEDEEWMGGVRALRDSHVRLVQRQLRHIERLNRALDRVTRGKSTKKVHV